jgi:hypothetical protein
VNISSNSTHTIINVTDTLPSPYTNSTTELSNYESFITGVYSNQTNFINSSNQSVISINTTAFQNAPSLHFINSNSSLNLNYTYTNLTKNELIVNGSPYISNYSITMRLNTSCLNSNCTNATWTGGPPNNDSSTAGLWHFDEGSGTTMVDSSGNGNNGTDSSASWVAGIFNSGLQFSWGVVHQVVVNDLNSLDMNSNFTAELWFNWPVGTGAAEWLLDKGNGQNHEVTNYELYLYGSYLYASIGNSTVYQNLISASAIQPNTWYHVAFTADGTTLKLYINGVLSNSTSQTITPAPNTGSLIIGSRDDSGALDRFNGTIDEVAIYSRAKSADEIYADANLSSWNWGPIAINNNLSAGWHFDEGTGNSSQDSSGNWNMLNFSGTSSEVLVPSSTNKAYSINSTSSDNPLLAVTEVTYSNVNASDVAYEVSTASYSNTFTLLCQHSGTCTCQGGGTLCWSLDACINYGGCSASCPSAANASTSSTCTPSASGCSVTCPSCIS